MLAGFASVGGRTWKVKLVRRWALFPLHARRPRHRSDERDARAAARRGGIEADDRDPHGARDRAAARPGAHPATRWATSGTSRSDRAGHPARRRPGRRRRRARRAVGHREHPARVSRRPRAEGVEWLAPEVHEQLGAMGHDAFGGKRTFDYVVRVQTPGDVDLGELALPFWDPEQKRYDVARASLGVMHVKPSHGIAVGIGRSAGGDARRVCPRRATRWRDAVRAPRAPRRRAAVLDAGHRRVARLRSAWPSAGRAAGRRIARAWRERKSLAGGGAQGARRRGGCGLRWRPTRAPRTPPSRARSRRRSVAHAGVSVRGAVGDEVAERLERAGVASRRGVRRRRAACASARRRASRPTLPTWPLRAIGGLARDGRSASVERRMRRGGTRRCARKRGWPSSPLRWSSSSRPPSVVPTTIRRALFAQGTSALQDGKAERGDRVVRGARRPRGGRCRSRATTAGSRTRRACASAAEVPGDLGRAAHGFEEARDLSRDPQLVGGCAACAHRGPVGGCEARARGRAAGRGRPGSIAGSRRSPGFSDEDTWAGLAVGVLGYCLRLGSSCDGSAGSGACGSAGASRRGWRPGARALVAMTLAARHDRLDVREAVVVAAGARPTDERGIALAGATPLPEGARVEVVDSRGPRPGPVRSQGRLGVRRRAARARALSAPLIRIPVGRRW